MAKSLGFYSYAPALLESWNDFHKYEFNKTIKFNKPCLIFKWTFKKYSGYGEIFYYDETKKVRNTFSDNESMMTITKPDANIVDNSGLKHYSTLYNEKQLETVFNKILEEYFSKQ